MSRPFRLSASRVFPIVAVLALWSAIPAAAVPIMYSMSGTATGTINLATFTNAAMTLTFTGDTSTITNETATTLHLPVLGSVTIAGFPTVPFAEGLAVFDNQSGGVLGFSRASNGVDILDLAPDSHFLSYGLAGNLGPLTGVFSGTPGQFTAIPTGAGALTVTSLNDVVFIAQIATTEEWIPVVSHAPGAGGSQWRTDAGLLDTSQVVGATVTLRLHSTAGITSAVVTVPRSGQVILHDVAAMLGMTNSSAALEVLADQPVIATSRTYNQQASGLTYGQGYDGIVPTDGLIAGDAGVLPQLTQNGVAGQVGTYRTNIGVTNTSSNTANVTVALFDANGVQVWSDTRSYGPGEWYQYQEPYRTGAGRTDIAAGFAVVTVNAGIGVTAYASVIDNDSSDPTTRTLWH
ncbi:MAG TPA: hypothetical protein VMT19_11920 [Thermoanaerobaculaceae bacterium]|nr:hypothetical protein [Thermoanaerobaculaceae bacterium]